MGACRISSSSRSMAGAPARIGSTAHRGVLAITANGAAAPPSGGQTALDQRLVAEPEGQRQQVDRGHVFAVPGTIVEFLAEPAGIVEPAARPSTIAWTPTKTGGRARASICSPKAIASPCRPVINSATSCGQCVPERVGLQLDGARGVARRRLGVAQRAGRRRRQEVHLRPRTDHGRGPNREGRTRGVGVAIGGGQEHAVGRLADGRRSRREPATPRTPPRPSANATRSGRCRCPWRDAPPATAGRAPGRASPHRAPWVAPAPAASSRRRAGSSSNRRGRL